MEKINKILEMKVICIGFSFTLVFILKKIDQITNALNRLPPICITIFVKGILSFV